MNIKSVCNTNNNTNNNNNNKYNNTNVIYVIPGTKRRPEERFAGESGSSEGAAGLPTKADPEPDQYFR